MEQSGCERIDACALAQLSVWQLPPPCCLSPCSLTLSPHTPSPPLSLPLLLSLSRTAVKRCELKRDCSGSVSEFCAVVNFSCKFVLPQIAKWNFVNLQNSLKLFNVLGVNYEIVVSRVCLVLSFSIIYPVLSLWLCRETRSLSGTLNYLCITANCVYVFFAAPNIREICLNLNNWSEQKLNNWGEVRNE